MLKLCFFLFYYLQIADFKKLFIHFHYWLLHGQVLQANFGVKFGSKKAHAQRQDGLALNSQEKGKKKKYFLCLTLEYCLILKLVRLLVV